MSANLSRATKRHDGCLYREEGVSARRNSTASAKADTHPAETRRFARKQDIRSHRADAQDRASSECDMLAVPGGGPEMDDKTGEDIHYLMNLARQYFLRRKAKFLKVKTPARICLRAVCEFNYKTAGGLYL